MIGVEVRLVIDSSVYTKVAWNPGSKESEKEALRLFSTFPRSLGSRLTQKRCGFIYPFG